MRLFGSERISGVMDKLGFKEGEMIEHNMISKSIERAQKKVEENHFGIRKRLLEYDDVMNKQREVVYRRRRQTLMGERLGVNTMDMIYGAARSIVNSSKPKYAYDYFLGEALRIFAIEAPISEEEFRNMKTEDVVERLFVAAMESFKRKMDNIANVANPVIKRVYEEQGERFQNIIIPITDGKMMYNIPVNLKEAYESEGKAIIKSLERGVLLHNIDEHWKRHLREMDELRNSVQNASYEQKDPLLIYKLESYQLYESMQTETNFSAVSILMRAQIPVQQRAPENVREAAPEEREDKSKYVENRSETPSRAPQQPRRIDPVRAEPRVGRNDPCPCGSGKKFKNCHGKDL